MANSSVVFQLWAKKERDSSKKPAFHPLVCHMLDTYAVCEQIVFGSSDRLFPDVAEAQRIVPLFAGMHDLGKASPAFQGQSEEATRILPNYGLELGRLRFPAKHGDLTAVLLADLLAAAGWKEELALRMGYCLGGHHGLFPNSLSLIQLKDNPRQNGDRRWAQARDELMSSYLDTLGFSKVPDIDVPCDNSFFVTLAGLITVSDWIASSETWFPYAHICKAMDLPHYLSIARHQAKAAIDQLSWHYLSDPPSPSSFGALFDFDELRPLQETAERVAQYLRDPAIVIIEAPMGEGKTEAAFYLHDWLQAVAGHRGLYVALPTQATSNQMFRRVHEFLTKRRAARKDGNSEGTHINLNLVHGHSLLSDDLARLRLRGITSEGEEEEAAVIAESWFTPKKRALLSPFAVGTVDQALMSVMQVRHSTVRLFGLANKTVVLDEVHAYDVYTSTIIDRMVQWLSSIGSSVVVLSATLPRERRNELIRAYGAVSESSEQVAYPRITWATRRGNETGCVHFDSAPRNPIQVEWIEDQPPEIASRLLDEVKDGGCAAWICNTVGRAQAAYKALREACQDSSVKLMLFHARYPYGERQRREQEVLDLFGKDKSKRANKAILVATQVIEQSLDLDFDLMATDFAPIDLVLQRVGREHRHEECRLNLARLRKPRLWIISPGTSDGGLPEFGPSARIYEEFILLKSWVVLRDVRQINIPEDIEDLIEAVYSTEDTKEFCLKRNCSDMIRRRLDVLGPRAERKNIKLVNRAHDSVTKSPWTDDDVMKDWSQNLHEDDDPRVHLSMHAQTRYTTLPSVVVVCLHHITEGLSLSPGVCEPVDLEVKPDPKTLKRLIEASLTISHPAVVKWFAAQPTPRGWRRNAVTRHMKLAVFCDGKMQAGQWELRLDDDYGLIIGKSQEVV